MIVNLCRLKLVILFCGIQKSPLGSPGWGSSSSAEKKRPPSHIPVRQNSTNDKDLAFKYESNAGRPTSLYSEPSRSSSSSTDGAPFSDSGSSYVSPSQNRKTFSYLSHPMKDFGPSSFPSVSESSHQEKDRLFRQSYGTFFCSAYAENPSFTLGILEEDLSDSNCIR